MNKTSASLDTQEIEVGDYRYRITKLTAGVGKQGLVRLMRVVGAGLEALPNGVSDVESLEDSDTIKIAGRVIQGLEVQDVDYFCDVFKGSTVILLDDDKEPKLSSVFDLHFAGRYMEMFQWLGACLMFNYGDFLEGIRVMMRSRKRQGNAAQTEQVQESE